MYISKGLLTYKDLLGGLPPRKVSSIKPSLADVRSSAGDLCVTRDLVSHPASVGDSPRAITSA